MAKIRFFYGVMGSSKTLNLLATAYKFEEKGIPFMVLKPSIDTRDGKNMIKSRAGLKRACVSVNSNVDIYEAIHQYNNVLMAQQAKPLMWVLVDECQFANRIITNKCTCRSCMKNPSCTRCSFISFS